MNFDTPPQALTICGEWNKIFEDTRHKRQAAPDCLLARAYPARPGEQPAVQEMYPQKVKAIPHNSRLTAQAPLRRLRHGICVVKMLDKTSSIICAFGLASAAPRSPYRHLELCGIALKEIMQTERIKK